MHGKLLGKNRMGRFLMALRSELYMMDVVSSAHGPSSEVSRKRKLET